MTARSRPEPVQQVKVRRDAVLAAIVAAVPYSRFLGVTFERRGDELTSVMAYTEDLIGNAMLPALHGGATAAFLELTAITGLSWSALWPQIEAGDLRQARAVDRRHEPAVDDKTNRYIGEREGRAG